MFRLSRSTLPPRQCRRLQCAYTTTKRSIAQSRPLRAATANPYPFPKSARPTPHQIFHLPLNASQADIKARYYDLVRIYHPDKGHQDLTPEAAHTRFQTITAAYDALRGKTTLTAATAGAAGLRTEPPIPQTTTAWRARTRREALYSGGDDRWKDRVILAGVIATVAILVIQVFTTRKQALAEAVAAQRRSAAAHRAQTSTLPSDPDSRLGAQ